MERKHPPIVVEEMSDINEVAKARRQRELFDRNAAWLQQHLAEVYAAHRGACICIAGEELFVAATPGEAVAQARVAHPEDDGWFIRYIPKEKVARISAL